MNGYYGTILRKCIQSGSNGNWDAIMGSCNGISFIFNDMFRRKLMEMKNKIAVNCPYISNEGNAKWTQTLANGHTVSGSCINGYYGTVSRKCTQDGSIGNWDLISGSCHGILLSFFFFFHFILFFRFNFNSNKIKTLFIISISINSCLLFIKTK